MVEGDAEREGGDDHGVVVKGDLVGWRMRGEEKVSLILALFKIIITKKKKKTRIQQFFNALVMPCKLKDLHGINSLNFVYVYVWASYI